MTLDERSATLTAVYHMQYKLNLFSWPDGVPDEPDFLYPDSDLSGWKDAGSWVSIKALPTIMITNKSKWVFFQWHNHLCGTNPNNNITFQMMQPWNVTAEYNLYHLAEWDRSPSTITVPGFPGSTWIKNGTNVWYGAPATDTTGVFQFYYWEINAVRYPQGQNVVYVGICTGPIEGTAYYANKTKMFMSPSRHEETAHAYGNKFNVTIYAANFDANRLVDGRPMDIYGFDIIVKFNPTLLEVQDVYLNLEDFFAPNEYFPAINKTDNAAGTYQLVATVKGNFTGFEGTKAIFTLTFRVIYDPCYPNYEECLIDFSYARLFNHLEQEIWPELWYHGCHYTIGTVKPMLEIRDAEDGDNTIVVHTFKPDQTFFDVQVWLLNGVKVHEFRVAVKYDPTQIEAVSVVIADYLKPPYRVYAWGIDKRTGEVGVWVAQDSTVPLQNCTGLLFTIRFKVIKSIFYTFTQHYLTSDIEIEVPYTLLGVKCSGPRYQPYPAELGAIHAKYVFNPLPGDLDLDGEVTVLDLQLVADNYGTLKYDINTDGTTDIRDLIFVARRFRTRVSKRP